MIILHAKLCRLLQHRKESGRLWRIQELKQLAHLGSSARLGSKNFRNLTERRRLATHVSQFGMGHISEEEYLTGRTLAQYDFFES